MSRGPGRVEREIELLLRALPSEAFDVTELVEIVYGPGKPTKPQRVAVLRAAKKVIARIGGATSGGASWRYDPNAENYQFAATRNGCEVCEGIEARYFSATERGLRDGMAERRAAVEKARYERSARALRFSIEKYPGRFPHKESLLEFVEGQLRTRLK